MGGKISIITINRNNAEGLRKTMESVFAQTYRDFEYIVVDGNSTDESVEVIKDYFHRLEIGDWRLENFHWISEPDTGIYNAMNKGLKMAHGEYTLMLNSGDFLVDEHVIERIIPELDGIDIIQGNYITQHHGQIYRNRGYGKSDIELFDIFKGHFLHQASFCRRELFDKYGYFDESYTISGDAKFFMLCLGTRDATFKYVDIDISNYDCKGVSAALSGTLYEQGRIEKRRVWNEVFSQRMIDHFTQNEKKTRLYNNLHQHKWIWWIVAVLAKLHDWIYGDMYSGIKREKIRG